MIDFNEIATPAPEEREITRETVRAELLARL